MSARLQRLRIVSPSESPIDDARLLERIAAGERAALGELYERYARPVFLFASRLVRDGSADDVVQQVFLRVARIAPAFDPRALSAKPWLFGITVRVVREQQRAARRLAQVLSGLFGAGRSETYAPFDRDDSLEKALGRLSTAKREVLLLADVEGFPCDEIAAMLGAPVGTIYTRLHHARKELRQHVEASR